MTQLNLNLPVIGQTNTTEDPKIRTALSDIQTVVNALDNANIANNAAINGSKLLDGSIAHSKIAAQTIDTKSDSYTPVVGDVNKIIAMNKSTAQTVTISSTLGLTVGQRIDVLQTGAGQVTFQASGTTVNGTPGLKTRAQYSAATILCTAADTYVILGDLAA